MSSANPAFEIMVTDALQVGYGNHILFTGMNLSLRLKELVCFMGPNGAGKSTLIRTLSGLQKPLAGRIHITDPLSPEKISLPANRIVAVVLTERVTAQHMTVADLVTFGRYPYLNWNVRPGEEDRKIINESINQVGIDHLRGKRLFELSDGQLQLAMIARALAQDTPLIILDEPTAHLDLNNRVEMMKLLRRLSHTMNKAILLATHDLDLALQTADRIWLTGSNQNIIEGIPEDLVLDGSFDSIFQFKGFDLKTGKVIHESHREKSVHINGSGFALLWTKNALERAGFRVNTEEQHDWNIEVCLSGDKAYWMLNGRGRLHKLGDLLEILTAD